MPATLYLRPSPRAFFLCTDTHALVFRQPDASESKASKSVVVAEFLPVEEVDMNGLVHASKGRTVEGVLGVTSVPSDRSPIPEIFLLLISHSTPLPPLIPSSSLRPARILAVEFHSLSSPFWDMPDLLAASRSLEYDVEYDAMSLTSQAAGEQGQAGQSTLQHPCSGMRKYLESGGFFYAEGCKWDISTRMGETNWVLEAQSAVLSSGGGGAGGAAHPLEAFDERFVWNSTLLAPLLDFRRGLSPEMKDALDSFSLLIPVIQGFCGSLPISTGAWSSSGSGRPEAASLGMISRLSWKRAGARFRTRGIDDDGQVANFVETELLLATESVCMGYVQVRGSVPLFWQQPSAGLGTLQQKVEITRPPQASQPAFDKHFLELLEHYHSVHAINLLGQKDAESMLSSAYSSHLSALKRTLELTPPSQKSSMDAAQRGTLALTPYDFHSAVKGSGHESVRFDFQSGLREVVGSVDRFGWTAIDAGTGQVVEEQQGVFRTNCLDCLDRTNYVQDVISSITLQRFLASIGSPLLNSASLWAAHRELWADNGDRLSKIYAGTGAINTSATRSGKKTFAGLLSDATKSVGRAYINNFQDKGKQTAIDMLLGMMAGQRPVILFDPISDSVQSALITRAKEYSSTRNVTIFSGTWNLNGKAPDEALDSWLFLPDTPEPDIYMIAFQEIVELTAGQILQTDPAKKRMWEKYIMDTFKMRRGGKADYILFRSEQLVGTALIVVTKSSLAPHIRSVESTTKKTGLQGLSGNKGGVGIRFNLYDSTVCFVTCHLAAGHSNVADRHADWRTLVQGMRFLRGKMVEDHEIVIWAADFNYRIAAGNQDVRDAIEAGEIDALLGADQLLNAMDAGEVFMGYDEGPVTFRPTYKYDNGTEDYDTSEKQRIPAWTDRVLFRGQALRLKEYDRAELMTSDHRPVYAVFEATIREVDHAKKDAIAKQLVHAVLQSGGENRVDEKVGVHRSGLDVPGGGHLSPSMRGEKIPKLPPRPSSAASMKEKGSPTQATGRIRSISSLQPPSTSASSSLRALATSASSSSLSSSRRPAPPVPPRPTLSPNPSHQSLHSPLHSALQSPTRSPASPRLYPPPARVASNGTGSSSSSGTYFGASGAGAGAGMGPVTPSSTGDFVLVPPSPSPGQAGAGRRAPPLPPRAAPSPKASVDVVVAGAGTGAGAGAGSKLWSKDEKSGASGGVSSQGEKTDVKSRVQMWEKPSVASGVSGASAKSSTAASAPTPAPIPKPISRKIAHGPKRSLDLNGSPPDGLALPVSPDVVINKPKLTGPGSCDGSPSSSLAMAAEGGGEEKGAKEVLGTSPKSKKDAPVVPKKPVALRAGSSGGE